MVLPSQFELGLELTNIINPMSQAVSTLGSLALVDAIKRSGSDSITEMKMASILGRHRIHEAIKVHFRKLVAKSDRSLISRYMDIILESGSGPTVQEALKNPALFSMVIQLSALSFAHQDEALAGVIVEAMEMIARELGGQTEIVPEYLSLLGTIRVCQQQTVAFRWLYLYEAVEQKLHSTVRASILASRATEGETKRRKVERPVTVKPESIGNRCLPFPALRSLLMWLYALQGLPEDRFLHLKCDKGISTVIVWCHHILGLDLTVRVQGVEIRFGDTAGNIFIESSKPQESEAVLMDPADQCQPLFTMTSDTDESIRLVSESRAEAFGYGRKILERAAMCEDDIHYCSIWITAQSIAAVRRPCNRDDAGDHIARHPSENRLLRAGRFFFGLDHLDANVVENHVGMPSNRDKFMKQSKCSSLMAMVFIFARIQEEDLEKCGSMPLSLYVFNVLRAQEGNFKNYVSCNDRCDLLDVITSFQVFSHLLLGRLPSDEYVRRAALVSAWGWSIFFQSMDAPDPEDVPTDTFRVMCGVPARGGIRRSRIIDGPETVQQTSQKREMICKDPPIFCLPGISTAKRGAILVGNTSDAFQVQMTFEWTSESLAKFKHRLGFREMQEMCVAVEKLPSCQCEGTQSDITEWIGEGALHGLDGQNMFGPSCKDFFFELKYPRKLPSDRSPVERVYTKKILLANARSNVDRVTGSDVHAYRLAILIYHVSGNPAARWIQLNNMWKLHDGQTFQLALKGQDTCFNCSTSYNADNKSKPTMLLT